MNIKELFSFEGRIKRWTFWKYILLCFLINVLLFILALLHWSLLILYIATLPFQVWINLAYPAKRLRDAGYPAWLTLAFYIPFVNLALLVVCGFFKSKPVEA